VRLAIPHYFDFGADRGLVGDGLAGAERWDALRLRSRGAFALPATRRELDVRADGDAVARERARAIDALAAQASTASYGAGTATAELWLRRLRPDRRVVVTEFAPETVARLAALLPELEVRRHDLRSDPPVDADLHLFHRIDTELDDDTFRGVLARFSRERLLVVATELLGARAVARELRTRLRGNATRAGLVRSRGAFEALWVPTHEATRVRIHDLHGWLLEPRYADAAARAAEATASTSSSDSSG
jgi:hypothetical protein